MDEACAFGDIREVERLLTERYDVNQVYESNEWTALHFACDEYEEEIVLLLISHGANVNAVTIYGNTPLHLTTTNPTIEIAKILLRNGANPDQTNKDGETARDFAVHRGQKKVAAYLTSVSQFPTLYTLFGPDVARDLFVNS